MSANGKYIDLANYHIIILQKVYYSIEWTLKIK